MQKLRAGLMCTLAVVGLLTCLPRAAWPDQEDSSTQHPLRVTRVFYLEGMDLHDVMMLLRREFAVRKIVIVIDRSAVVVSDGAEKVDQCERLLRERNAVVRTAELPSPLLGKRAKGPTNTRVFPVNSNDIKTFLTVLRTIYDVGEMTSSPDDSSISIRAAEPVLEACEALLRELRLVAEPATS